jgi:DNA-binding response OmpR family regulator
MTDKKGKADQTVKTILVVDDEQKIRIMISDYLASLGYRVLEAENGRKALELISADLPDCVVLDLMMPGIDGMDVTRRAREISPVPILMLTARSQEPDKLMGLEVGADDYMVKPFSLKELAARVRALIRREERFASLSNLHTVLQFGEFTIDDDKMQISRAGVPIPLTTVQYKITSLMFKNPGKVFTRMELLETFQDIAFEGYERTIDVHIKNIRKAVEPNPAEPVSILTVWGMGYKAAEISEGL